MRFRDLLRDKTLTRTELAIVSFLVQHAEDASHFTVRELARAAFVSPAAVVRLYKKLGFGTFADMKVELARQLSNEGEFSFSTADYPELDQASEHQVIHLLGTMKRTAVNETSQLLDEQNLRPVVDAMARPRGITVAGLGSSGVASTSFSMNLSHLGYHVKHATELGDLRTWARSCPNDELFVLCSYSGESPLLEGARIVAERSLDSLSVTAEADNTLASLTTWNIRIPEIEGRFSVDRVAAFCSVTEMECALDVLYALLFSRHYAENLARSRRINPPDIPEQ